MGSILSTQSTGAPSFFMRSIRKLSAHDKAVSPAPTSCAMRPWPRCEVGRYNFALSENGDGAGRDRVERPFPGARFGQDSIHQLLFAGADEIRLDERVFFQKSVQQRLRCVDGHRSVPDELGFFLSAFDQG